MIISPAGVHLWMFRRIIRNKREGSDCFGSKYGQFPKENIPCGTGRVAEGMIII